jgi:hypothetical protein
MGFLKIIPLSLDTYRQKNKVERNREVLDRERNCVNVFVEEQKKKER